MVDRKIGFVGAGTMAFAIMRGMINKNVVAADNIYMYDIATERLQSIAAEYGVHAVSSNNELADLCDILIVAVKPYVVEKALADMKEHFRPEQIVMSIVGGFSTKRLKACLERRARALKIMPNTPAQGSAGVMLISNDNDLSPDELAMVKELLSSSGLVETMDEDKLYSFSAVGGTIPAFVAIYVEALADAGVLKLHARSSHHERRKPASVVDWRRTVQGRFFYAAMSTLIKVASCSPVEPQIVQPGLGKRTHSKVKP